MARQQRNVSPPQLPKAFTERLEFANLNDEEKERIREMAREQVSKERKAAEQDRFMDQALREARSEFDPTFQVVDVLIDLPGHAMHLLIDGVQYLHGLVYEVPKPVADTINEMMQRAWDHEEEIGGANRSFYQKPRDIRLTRRSQNITTARLMG